MKKIYTASDHAGFIYKQEINEILKYDGYNICDLGSLFMNPQDDYPDFIAPLAYRVAAEPESLGIIYGGSGQGEAIVANRTVGIRAVVYTTDNLDIITVAREHNNANILSIGARFVSLDHAKKAVRHFLKTRFVGEERHVRRIQKIDGKHAVNNKIVPAVLPFTSEEAVLHEKKVRGLFPLFQLDVVDGIFAQGDRSWLGKVSTEEESNALAIFHSFKVPFEVDLMVEQPEKKLSFWIKSPAKRLIFHFGSTEKLRDCCEKTRRTGREAYIALHIRDNPEWIRPYQDCIDGVQCMGIDPVGGQGREMHPEAPTFIRSVREIFSNLTVTVDGGVKLWNARSFILCGADRLTVGSGLFTGDTNTNKKAFARALVSQ